MILADTSAWIEYDRATESDVDLRLTELIAEASQLAVTEPVIMEVLVGARTEQREAALLRLLFRFEVLPFQSQTDFLGAARIYRRCRTAGITPRGTVDCMIAAVAQRTGASLLSHDSDLSRIAQIVGIPLDDASLRVS